MSSQSLVVGCDGGGTQTRILLTTLDGVELGEGQSGTGNVLDVGEDGLRQNLKSAWEQACHAAGIPTSSKADALALGLAGSGNTEGREAILRATSILPQKADRQPLLLTDVRIAHAGGFADGPGIVIVAGTGSCAYGRTADGLETRSGGWGPFLDDVGSAFDLGRRALQAIAAETDGRGGSTDITKRILNALGCDDLRDSLPKLDHRSQGRRSVASLAPIVTEAAEQQDTIALQILHDSAGALAATPLSIARQLNLESPPIIFVGGLATGSPLYRTLLQQAISARLPNATFPSPLASPAKGAALLAALSLIPHLDPHAFLTH